MFHIVKRPARMFSTMGPLGVNAAMVRPKIPSGGSRLRVHCPELMLQSFVSWFLWVLSTVVPVGLKIAEVT